MTDTSQINIAAYWQYRMSQSASISYDKPDSSLADFTAIAAVPPTVTALISEANTRLGQFLATPREFNVGTSSQDVIILCDGTSSTRADLALLALFGQTTPTGTKIWLDNNGKSTTLTGAQLVTLATIVGTWIADCYGALSLMVGQITASPPSITTTAQIDSYAWPQS